MLVKAYSSSSLVQRRSRGWQSTQMILHIEVPGLYMYMLTNPSVCNTKKVGDRSLGTRLQCPLYIAVSTRSFSRRGNQDYGYAYE